MTDVHRSVWVSHDDVAHAVATLMSERPDIDRPRRRLRDMGRSRVRRSRPPRRCAPLSAPQGVFAILGNHDDDHDMPAALAQKRRSGAEGRAHATADQAARRSISSGSGSGPSARSTSPLWCATPRR